MARVSLVIISQDVPDASVRFSEWTLEPGYAGLGWVRLVIWCGDRSGEGPLTQPRAGWVRLVIGHRPQRGAVYGQITGYAKLALLI
jgi:hypothetical protein